MYYTYAERGLINIEIACLEATSEPLPKTSHYASHTQAKYLFFLVIQNKNFDRFNEEVKHVCLFKQLHDTAID
jgi:hypothetical protein